MERLNAGAYRRALQMLDPARDAAILEVGFGTLRLIEMLADRVADGRVAGVDPTETMVAVARNRPALRAAAARVDLRVGEASRLPWPDASFAAVAAVHCFQFWPDPLAGLGEIRRVLRPGERLVLILRRHRPGRAPAWLPNPISRSADEIAGTRAALVEAGFIVQNPSTPGSPHALLAIRP